MKTLTLIGIDLLFTSVALKTANMVNKPDEKWLTPKGEQMATIGMGVGAVLVLIGAVGSALK